ncbi:hypothetical protein ACP70R_030038 [Stipagrostis hirtigluma subsp. patula]
METPPSDQGKEAPPPRPTLEELRATRAHWEAAKADMNRFLEETLREIEEYKKSGRDKDPSAADEVVDMDAWKRRYAKVVRDFPPPPRIFPGRAEEFLKYLDE